MTTPHLLFFALLFGAAGCEDGVTPACPAMPIVDRATGQPVGPTAFDDPTLGPGGALNRWQLSAAAEDCATLPGGTAGAAGSAP